MKENKNMQRRPKVENPGKIFKRLFMSMMQSYLVPFIIVVICIVIAAFANVQASLFSQTLIDDYIVPLTESDDPNFGPLAHALLTMASVYLIGIISSYAYNRIMVNVTQGTLRNIRMKMFKHMESLPIKYFDTHAHGDIMSVYTNDIDTLRQLISQSIPQLINSVITIVMVFVSMVMLSIPLTILTLVMVAVMLFCTRKLAGQSGMYFGKQQRDLGALNGYIEEMMSGQKVVKVFCHEEKSLKDFRALNERLRDSANNANTYANILMPVNAQLGNVSYVLCAVVGAILAINGQFGLSLGALVAFVQLNKSFNMPITQVSQQLNSVVMAMAGAERIF
jgi:ABC-type multidrug transport system, ATPase and permease components